MPAALIDQELRQENGIAEQFAGPDHDRRQGVPRTVTVTDAEVREALAEPIRGIVKANS